MVYISVIYNAEHIENDHSPFSAPLSNNLLLNFGNHCRKSEDEMCFSFPLYGLQIITKLPILNRVKFNDDIIIYQLRLFIYFINLV